MRQLAATAGLATASRKDSQGICFLGKVRFSEFVEEHLGTWSGPIVEEESGALLGVHQGYWFYTVSGVKFLNGILLVMVNLYGCIFEERGGALLGVHQGCWFCTVSGVKF